MNLYGVLGSYLPAFGLIEGRMQYDLFHAFTVDEHTLFVVSNLRRLALTRFNHEFPEDSQKMQSIESPEILYIAGLFHDIAKGRGGDHSILGADEAEMFCLDHGLTNYDSKVVSWLVMHHLVFSLTAQKKDIYDMKAQLIQDNIIQFRMSLSSIHNYCKNQLNINDIREDYTNNNVLSLLTYVFSKKTYRDCNHELLNLWFWNSMVFNRFPGSQLQLIEKDTSAFDKGEDTFKRAINQRRNLLILNDEHMINGTKLIDAGYQKVNSKIYQSCILLLNSLKPVDFDGKHEIQLADYIGSNTKNNKHHIIPYNSDAGKELRKQYAGSKGEFILNNIANIAIIGSGINKEISKKSPKKYFEKYESRPNFKEILKTHLIDDVMYEDLKNERYEEFLITRTRKILNLIKEKCSIDKEKFVFETHDSSEDEDNDN